MASLTDLLTRLAPSVPPSSDSRARSVARRLRAVAPTSVTDAVRLGQFALVGALGAVVDTATLLALVEGWGVGPVPATIVGKELSITFMFAVNHVWTFGGAPTVGRRGLLWRYCKSNAVRWVGGAVGVAVLAVLYHGFDVWYLLANVVGIGVGFFVNYAFESVVTFGVE